MSDEETRNLPAIQHAPTIHPALARLLEPGGEMWSSLDVRIPEQRPLFFKAQNDPDIEVEGAIEGPIFLAHVYADIKEKLNEDTGELVSLPRLVLIDQKGVCYQTWSKYIRQSLEGIFYAFGRPPFSPAIPISIVEKKSSKKRTFFSLRVHYALMDAKAAAAAADAKPAAKKS